MFWLLVAVALITFAVESGFMVIATAKRMRDAKVTLPRDIKYTAYFWLAIGYPADVLFNVTRGTVMFRELPRELLFSSRVQRHVKAREHDFRYHKALFWAKVLNAADDGHIDL